MEKRKILNIDDEELIRKAADNKEILDYIQTDQKYNSTMESLLIHMHGEGFISNLKQERYENIPGNFTEEEIAIWEAEMALYHADFCNSYPEARQYMLKKEGEQYEHKRNNR